jgi:hypothetical protein
MELTWPALEVLLERFIINDAVRTDDKGLIVGDVRPGVLELAALLSEVFDPPVPNDTASSHVNVLYQRPVLSDDNKRLAAQARSCKTHRDLLNRLWAVE